MRMLFGFLGLLFTSGAIAQTNTYQWQKDNAIPQVEVLVSSSEGTTVLPATDYNSGSSIRAASQKTAATSYRLNMLNPLSDELLLNSGIGFVSQTFGAEESQNRVSGLSNINLGLAQLKLFETFTLIYGVNSSVSLSPLKFDSVTPENSTNVNAGERPKNNYTGYNTYTAYVGSEFIVGKVNYGARGNFNFYQSRFDETAYHEATDGESLYESRNSIGLDVFAELPLSKTFQVGVLGGAETVGMRINDFVRGNGSTNSHSGIYGAYDYDVETRILVGLNSESRRVYYDVDKTELTIGVTRAL